MNVLILTGGLHPDKSNFDLFIASNRKYDFVIAADSGFDTSIAFKIKCDIVIGDMDSVMDKITLARMPKERVISYPKDKDYTDTELALLEAKKRGATSITLVGGDGGRLDHTLALLKIFEGDLFPDMWLCKEQVVFLLDENRCAEKKLTLSQQGIISIFSVNNSGVIHSKGLEWELNDLCWDKGAYSVSNRVDSQKSQDILLTVKKGRFFVILAYSDYN